MVRWGTPSRTISEILSCWLPSPPQITSDCLGEYSKDYLKKKKEKKIPLGIAPRTSSESFPQIPAGIYPCFPSKIPLRSPFGISAWIRSTISNI